MKKNLYLILIVGVTVFSAMPLYADVCKIRCRTDKGVICLERGSCEPINEFLVRAARDCRKWGPDSYVPITKLGFVDILSIVIRLDKELPQGMDRLKDEERYILETRLLSEKGISIFNNINPFDPLTREELATILKTVTIEEELGYSSGLAGQTFDLKNEGFVIYDAEVYVDEGEGFELWERKRNFRESLSDSKDYVIKLDSCGNAKVVFGDNVNGKIPLVGSKLKAMYNLYGKEDEIVTECEVAMLLSNRILARSLREAYNPSRALTKANFADLLVRTMGLESQLPKGYGLLDEKEQYKARTEILLKNGINIFIGAEPDDLLTREELARVLYDSPVEEIIGVSDGTGNQGFGLNNAGFIIYDLHVYAREDNEFREWNKEDNFIESSSISRDYIVKLDSGNYATIYFGDGDRGMIPLLDSPIRVTYRLYAPLDMLTEDDIICVLGKKEPVVETYVPPFPPPEFPPPTDGFDDPASHI